MLNYIPSISILIITARSDHGGGPKHIETLLEGLSKKFEFHIACPHEQPYYNKFSKYAECVEIPHRTFSITVLLGLVRYIYLKKIDIIHSHGKGAGLYSRLLGFITRRPVIHSFHGFHYQHLTRISRWLYLKYEQLFSNFTKIFINVSESEQSRCVKAKLYQKTKSIIVPNGIKLPQLHNSNISNNKVNIINISRLSDEKNINDLIRIIALINKRNIAINVKIIGDGPKRSELELKSKQYGVAQLISFLGFRDDVYSILKTSDIYLTTSHGEGLPISVMEAMACSLPVVASRVSGHIDLIEHGVNGFLFDLDKIDDAEENIIKLIADSALFQCIVTNAYKTIKNNYSAKVMCDRIADIYNSVVKKSRR